MQRAFRLGKSGHGPSLGLACLALSVAACGSSGGGGTARAGEDAGKLPDGGLGGSGGAPADASRGGRGGLPEGGRDGGASRESGVAEGSVPVDGGTPGDAAKGPGCGNGTRDPGEECDDGNRRNLDGCSASCRFEQIHALGGFSLVLQSDARCPNAIATALSVASALPPVAMTLDAADVPLFSFTDLADLTGATDGPVGLGLFAGAPALGDGGAALDAWYVTDPASVDASRNPRARFDASVQAGHLTAALSRVSFAVDTGAGSRSVDLSNLTLDATIGTASSPLASSGGSPGHLASENLDPAIESFSTLDGILCGNATAASLALVPIPAFVLNGVSVGGYTATCSQGYSSANTLLDLAVGGCSVGPVGIITSVQPEAVDPGAPQPGSGGPYQLSLGAGAAVTSCRDSSGTDVDLTACLRAASYPLEFLVSSARAIAR